MDIAKVGWFGLKVRGHLAPAFVNRVNLYLCHDDSTTTISIVIVVYHFIYYFILSCLQCFDAVGWVAGRTSGL